MSDEPSPVEPSPAADPIKRATRTTLVMLIGFLTALALLLALNMN